MPSYIRQPSDDESSDSDTKENLTFLPSRKSKYIPPQLSFERILQTPVGYEPVKQGKRAKSSSVMKKSSLMSLQQAARDGRIDIVQDHLHLIGKDKKKLNDKDLDQTTALHYAVRYGHLGIVKLLVEGGASVNVQGECDATPLHYAARYVFKTTRKWIEFIPLSKTMRSATAKKSKDRDFRSFARLGAYKGKHGLVKDDRKASVGLKAKSDTLPNRCRSATDVLSVGHFSLKNLNMRSSLGKSSIPVRSLQKFPISSKSNEHLLLSPVASRFAEAKSFLAEPRESISLDTKTDKTLPGQQALKISRSAGQPFAGGELSQSVSASISSENCLERSRVRPDGGVDKARSSIDKGRLPQLSSVPDEADKPFSDHLISQLDSVENSISRNRRHSAPDITVHQPTLTGLECAPLVPQSVSSELCKEARVESLRDSKAIGSDDVCYPSDNPTVLAAGTFTRDEISEVNALILPSICQVAVDPDGSSLVCVDKKTLSLPDIKASLVNESMSFAGEIVAGYDQPTPTALQAERVNAVSGKLNFRRNLKVGAVKPLFVTKKVYVGKAVAGDSNFGEDGSILKYLLGKGADQNARDLYGCTPLHYAATRGNVSAARQLLSQQNISTVKEAKDHMKMTPLHCAASVGSLEICDLLLQHGANIRCVDAEGMTPLHYAAMEGYLEIVQLFFRVCEVYGGLKGIAEVLLDKDRDEETALHLAVEHGHIDIVKECISRGANVNLRIANLMTPLHVACTSGQLDVVQLLVEHDADIEATNALGETPLHRAALFNRFTIVRYLLEKNAYIDCRDKDKETPLMMAIKKNNVETVQILLERNTDVSAKEASDRTCLYLAAEGNCVQAFERLIEEPNVKCLLEEFDWNENTPLHMASMKGYIKIVKLLLDAGACIDAKNDTNLTPLHLAAKHGRPRTVKVLLAQDVSIVNDEDDALNTPLHLAALEGHVKVVKILLQCGAAVDARNANLWTPLDCAAYRGWTWCAEALLDGDSLVDPQDKAKATPLHLACKEGHVDMVNLLLSRKADITRKDHMGRNCLDWAIENKQRDAAMALVSSSNWEAVMRNCSVDGSVVTTPMRKLIKSLPDVAEKVFNQCMTGNNLPRDHPLYEVKCNYEFLEDSFTEWRPSFYDPVDFQPDHNQFVEQQVETRPLGRRSRPGFWRGLAEKIGEAGYGRKQIEIMQNHPLNFMVLSERTKLLCHPLVTYLLRHKWRACGRYVYYSKLILYAFFLIFLTSFSMIITSEKHALRCAAPPPMHAIIGAENCSLVCLPVVKPLDSLHRTVFVDFARCVVFALACIGLLLEMASLVRGLYSYLRPHRCVDLASHVLSLIYVLEGMSWSAGGTTIHIVDYARCTMWHRSVGALAIFFSWLSLVMFMRKLPKIGIYVVMFTHLLKTFAQFSVVFLLFIVAFGLAFHMSLFEQDTLSFLTPLRAMVKTLLGMLGEFEYDSVFNEPDAPGIPTVVWPIYIVYIIVNWTLLMNLLTGLAVEDIKGIQEQAVLTRLAMQVELVLDVEKTLPLSWQRRLIKMEETIRPNAERGLSLWSFWSVTSAAPSSSTHAQPNAVERIQKQQEDMKETVRELRDKVKFLENQNARLDAMVGALVKHYGINVELEPDKEEHR